MIKFTLLAFIFTLVILSASAQSKLNLYGGKKHDLFLGCINCSTEDPKSVWCIYGDYGSTHNAKSIWNENGIYGSRKSDYSPFGNNSKYPPLIVDENGKSYGYLTINKKNPKRTWHSFGKIISENRDEIVKDIPDYYNHMSHVGND